jgi:diadenylate cyclase
MLQSLWPANFSWINGIDISVTLLILVIILRKVRSNLAFNIFLGVLFFYAIYILARYSKMPLLTFIFDKIISVGLLGLIIVFQPEVRKFLLSLGRISPFANSGFINKFFSATNIQENVGKDYWIEQIGKALKYFIENRLGAILVIPKNSDHEFDLKDSVLIEGNITCRLLESIFEKNSPLHDGAVIIANGTVQAARVILPLSDDDSLPRRIGLRHRAAVGASVFSDALIIIVSEENNVISLAIDGKLFSNTSMEEVKKQINEYI